MLFLFPARFLSSPYEWEGISSWLSIWPWWDELPHVRIVLYWPHLHDRPPKSHCPRCSDEMPYCWHQGVFPLPHIHIRASFNYLFFYARKRLHFFTIWLYVYFTLFVFVCSCMHAYIQSLFRLSWWLETIQLQQGQLPLTLVSSQKAVKQWKTLRRGRVFLLNKSTRGIGRTAVHQGTIRCSIMYISNAVWLSHITTEISIIVLLQECDWTAVFLWIFILCNSGCHCGVCVQGRPSLCDQRWSAERYEQWGAGWGTAKPSGDGVCENISSAETDYCGELSTSGKYTQTRTHRFFDLCRFNPVMIKIYLF